MENIRDLLKTYRELDIESTINYEEFNKILITSHSTRIEGSTLSFGEAVELIQKGNTPGGKPINFSHLTLDHHNALNFVLDQAKKGRELSVKFIQEIASKVMERTGEVYENILGVSDSSKGDFRNTSVRAGTTVFMNFQKVPSAMENLVQDINSQIHKMETLEEKLLLSFYAHYKLVDIHPFLDGNGRTSRLLMNFIQKFYDLPLSIVFEEDKPEYYKALDSIKQTESFDIYDDFMFRQYSKLLKNEIQKVKEATENDIEIKPKWKR